MADLLAMLASRRETGRLDVNLESSTAQLFLMEGKPVDCSIGFVKGAEALDLLLSEAQGTFRFSSGAVPPNLMFSQANDLRRSEPPVTAALDFVGTGSNNQISKERFRGVTVVVVLAVMAGVVGLTIGSGIASIQHRTKAAGQTLKSPLNPAPSTQQPQQPLLQANQSTSNHRSSQITSNASQLKPQTGDSETSKKRRKTLSIPVALRIEDGRVVEAYASQPMPGREAYEATAVRLARQRRFDIKSGTETVVLTITEK